MPDPTPNVEPATLADLFIRIAAEGAARDYLVSVGYFSPRVGAAIEETRVEFEDRIARRIADHSADNGSPLPTAVNYDGEPYSADLTGPKPKLVKLVVVDAADVTLTTPTPNPEPGPTPSPGPS